MGIIETVNMIKREEGIEIGKEIGKEIGTEIGVFTTKLKNQLDLLKTFKDRNFALADLSDMVKQPISFVKNFKSDDVNSNNFHSNSSVKKRINKTSDVCMCGKHSKYSSITSLSLI